MLEEIILRVFKSHPNLVFFVLIVGAIIMGYSYRVFAETVDLQALEIKHDTEFTLLSRKISYGFAEIKLRAVEGEIFQLEGVLRREGDLSDNDTDRLSTLRSDLSALKRQLQQIEEGREI